MCALLVLLAPFALVAIPPLTDVPGHTAAAAIEAARAGDPLLAYYRWRWSMNLNMGGEVVLALLAPLLGVERAGWAVTVIATGLVAAGCMATARALNPRGQHGLGWALMYVTAFPWVWGFLNYQLAVGSALLVFALSVRWFDRPHRYVALLLVAQPLLLLCHGVGGILLALLVMAHWVGRRMDLHQKLLQPAILMQLWPLAMTPLVVLMVMLPSMGEGQSIIAWRPLKHKLAFLLEVLRDQNQILDISAVALSLALLLFGKALGARWAWQQLLPVIGLLALYLVIPDRINGSESCDVRLLSVVMLAGLALQDWSTASNRVRQRVLCGGVMVLVLRLAFVVDGFAEYDRSYRQELVAVDHMRVGSRVLVYFRHNCSEGDWRMKRLDMLPALASARRRVWINRHWTLPGLDMTQSLYSPSKEGVPSAMVWTGSCRKPDRISPETALAKAPLAGVDYLWLMDTGLPMHMPAGLIPVWQNGDSYLFAVSPSVGLS